MWNSLSLLPKPRLSWFESWDDGDQSAIDSTALLKKWLLPIAFEIIEMTWNDLNLFCQLYGFKSPYHLKLLLNHIGHHMTALRVRGTACEDEDSSSVRSNMQSVQLATGSLKFRPILQPGIWKSMSCCYLMAFITYLCIWSTA